MTDWGLLQKLEVNIRSSEAADYTTQAVAAREKHTADESSAI
jgi:hypothetical protein